MSLSTFLRKRGWYSIPDWTKHGVGSCFLVVCLYGIPRQWFGVQWDASLHLLGAALVAWGIGFAVEFGPGGNRSHRDIWYDFAGVVLGVLLCAGMGG